MFMNSSASSSPAIDAEAIQAHSLTLLSELMDKAADVARVVHRQAMESTCRSPLGSADGIKAAADSASAFDCIARAVRRTIAMARVVAEPLKVRAPGLATEQRVAARKRIIRAVDDSIDDVEGPEQEVLRSEFRERLDAPELDEEIGNRPVGEIIADILRDLGRAGDARNPAMRRVPSEARAIGLVAAVPPGEAVPDEHWTALSDGVVAEPRPDEGCVGSPCPAGAETLHPDPASPAGRRWSG